MKPLFKCVGGKSRLLSELRMRLPLKYGRYFEPFAGGAALLFDLQPDKAVLGDMNHDLMVAYRAIAHDPNKVLDEFSVLRAAHTGKESYYERRQAWNESRNTWGPTRRAAYYLYINRTNFNGLWRTNKKGDLNTPAGSYKNPFGSIEKRVLHASSVLAKAELTYGHYRATTMDAEAGDLVYFDPPYVPVTKTSNFVNYTADGFTQSDQCELAEWACELMSRGVHVVLSNSDTPLTRSLYDDWFNLDEVKCGRSINSDATKRGKVTELIMTPRPGMVRSDSRQITLTV